MAIKLHPSLVVHPGEFLFEEFVRPYGMNVSSTAEHLGITRPNMSRLLNGKAGLTPEMARRFEDAFGVSAALLMRMQSAYDLAQIDLSGERTGVKRIPEPVYSG